MKFLSSMNTNNKNLLACAVVCLVATSFDVWANEPVYLECSGTESLCSIGLTGERSCSESVTSSHLIQWQDTSIKHLTNNAILAFTEQCLANKSEIKCYSNENEYSHLYASNTRTFTLSRMSGKFDYESRLKLPEEKSRQRMTAYDVITYSGKCYPRTSQFLF